MLTGSCACAKVRYEVDAAVEEAHHCHCSVCRKCHGAAFATYARVRAGRLRLLAGADEVAVFRSSEPVSRSFCRSCGSSLFFAHRAAPQFVWLAAGTLDAGEVRPDAHVFVDSLATWWSITDEVARYPRQRPEYGG